MNSSVASKQSHLRYWLAQEDWHRSEYTRNWLARTPPAEAADVLARIAEDAQPEPHSMLSQVVGGLSTVFATSENVGSAGIVARRVGTRAALMLADMGDERCLPPLVRVFETSPTWQGKYQELVETALAHFLSQAAGQPGMRKYENDVRRLAGRAWNTGGGSKELSDTAAELLIAILRFLRALRGAPNLDVIRSIAAVPVSKPNRRRVKETAQSLLNV